MPSLPKGIKIYRKLRHRKGHGVHSPFVYNLITKVIEERSPYYVFREIENIRKEIIEKKDEYSRITVRDTQNQKYGALLFRLINFFQCKNVLQIGTSTGIMSLYLSSARSDCECVAVEDNDDIGNFASGIIRKLGLKNFRIEIGHLQDKTEELFNEYSSFDLFFINIPEHASCPEVINKCLKRAKKEAIFVIEGINGSQKMRNTWKNLVLNPEITVSIDLYRFGIVFLRENIHKQHYKIYFDNGKKQALHKNGRQRFHFFSRRKKSSENTYSLGRIRHGR